MRYSVQWRALIWPVMNGASLSLIVSVVGMQVIRYLFPTLSCSKAIEKLSFLEFLGFFFGAWLIVIVLSVLVVSIYRAAHITIDNDVISGRNFWLRSVSFPLSNLQSIESFSYAGLDAVVANGGSFGKIYIFHQTENIEEIVDLLVSHLPVVLEA